ncbi:hypothetical protein J1614_011416 [Plenodomus biglobosus]|nr:hypothetical protein J1614_011416 [Plenodomus biglobosus]
MREKSKPSQIQFSIKISYIDFSDSIDMKLQVQQANMQPRADDIPNRVSHVVHTYGTQFIPYSLTALTIAYKPDNYTVTLASVLIL